MTKNFDPRNNAQSNPEWLAGVMAKRVHSLALIPIDKPTPEQKRERIKLVSGILLNVEKLAHSSPENSANAIVAVTVALNAIPVDGDPVHRKLGNEALTKLKDLRQRYTAIDPEIKTDADLVMAIYEKKLAEQPASELYARESGQNFKRRNGPTFNLTSG